MKIHYTTEEEDAYVESITTDGLDYSVSYGNLTIHYNNYALWFFIIFGAVLCALSVHKILFGHRR